MSTDPLDLPMFTDPGSLGRGPGQVDLPLPRTRASPDPAAGTRSGGAACTVPCRPQLCREDPVAVPDADWELVARMRTEVARRLAEQMGEARWDREAEEAEGAAIIRQLLEEDTAEAIVRVGQARSLAEQEVLAKAVFDAMFRLGRLQPLVDDEQVENVMITGFDRVVVERADGTCGRRRRSPTATRSWPVSWSGWPAARRTRARSPRPARRCT